MIGTPSWELVKGGPRLTEREWRAALVGGELFGEADLVTADGRHAVGALRRASRARHRAPAGPVRDARQRAARPVRASDATEPWRDALSDREREVVHLVALGHTSKEIADELHIAHNTVRTHVRNAQEKLGARSRAQLVAIALGDGHAASS